MGNEAGSRPPDLANVLSTYGLKNHVSPVRFWPSAQCEFPSKFTKHDPRKPASNTVKPLLYGQKEPGMGGRSSPVFYPWLRRRPARITEPSASSRVRSANFRTHDSF